MALMTRINDNNGEKVNDRTHLVICFAARAIAYSATTVLPADVWAATKTLSPSSSL